MFVSSQKPCRQSDLFATLLLSMSAAKSRLRLYLEAKASKSSTFWDRIVSVLERHGVDEDNVDALDEVHLLQFGISAADAPMLALLLKGPPVLRFVFVHIILLFSFLFQCFAHLSWIFSCFFCFLQQLSSRLLLLVCYSLLVVVGLVGIFLLSSFSFVFSIAAVIFRNSDSWICLRSLSLSVSLNISRKETKEQRERAMEVTKNSVALVIRPCFILFHLSVSFSLSSPRLISFLVFFSFFLLLLMALEFICFSSNPLLLLPLLQRLRNIYVDNLKN